MFAHLNHVTKLNQFCISPNRNNPSFFQQCMFIIHCKWACIWVMCMCECVFVYVCMCGVYALSICYDINNLTLMFLYRMLFHYYFVLERLDCWYLLELGSREQLQYVYYSLIHVTNSFN